MHTLRLVFFIFCNELSIYLTKDLSKDKSNVLFEKKNLFLQIQIQKKLISNVHA
jgi:hypothetical protein